ncbi:MAG: alanine--tRNA ligase [Chloroflexi bacterium GWB2_49_20]|nr:MAG: alanine--tRNA ligase [Chloroflexi bacterium GWB2_49_20]OGN79978.1 MAG: alanine--tRNA ligase [Chloroflexi bacterium GWC2_49_37]OGN85486.1 MAG: alanine--tRNA ligase [Chloroflexi bacterium GWD2_49_16]HBG74355.1 alanine--tRNA ligase [Anaerolineae bacterium]HCM97035.1 alanine--tRNA ligase [Anaerolineae bacterium]
MQSKPSAAEIRKSFLDYFLEQGHTFVPSASLVPGGDATLLFTNAGMVQFKDVFLGTDKRSYKRATNSQKCMRVAGKHNDLEDVGTDDSHHTFFEMLGNWSFGDYYKKEAIEWAWQLLTDVWGLPKSQLYATCFKDDKGDIPSDEEAAENWRKQTGMLPEHVLYFGRKDNFWEMAETGPCGPCSEIHIDRGVKYCDLQSIEGHQCKVNGDCKRFLELWNLVFIQYNRLSPTQLNPLPATHVDTGMGFERIVSVLQEVDSNYKTDLFTPALDVIRSMTGESEGQMLAHFTPYRVIADHARAAAFLIADGVVPGNTGRNYVCRMIIRRAARFGTKIGLYEPFLARVADAFVDKYAEFFPEMSQNRQNIIDNLTREEVRFAKTIESGTAVLDGLLEDLNKSNNNILPGDKAFELYATYGLPYEITRDIAHEHSLEVDEYGFRSAMDNHRLASGGGKAMGELGGEDAEMYNQLTQKLINKGSLGKDGVVYDPYQTVATDGKVLALVEGGQPVEEVYLGANVAVIVPKTGFYIESGGQLSDTGVMCDAKGTWEIEVHEMRKPAAGMITHVGEVTRGNPKVGDEVVALVDLERRRDIMRNHTATHLLHAELHKVLGEHARQAGSLVAPERLRFDFNHNETITTHQLEQIEMGVNKAILADMPVIATSKTRDQAISEGATALFGEKYGDVVRTILINAQASGSDDLARYSYELCGGTHLDHTGNIGTFVILSEGSAAAGVHRIEAATGRAASQIVSERLKYIRQLSKMLSSSSREIVSKVSTVLDDLNEMRRQTTELRNNILMEKFNSLLENVPLIKGVQVMRSIVDGAEIEVLRNMCDQFRQKYSSGIAVLGTVINGRPIVVATVTEDIIKRGVKAGDLVKYVAQILGGSGGGKPTLAQAGGKDPSRLGDALEGVINYIETNLK